MRSSRSRMRDAPLAVPSRGPELLLARESRHSNASSCAQDATTGVARTRARFQRRSARVLRGRVVASARRSPDPVCSRWHPRAARAGHERQSMSIGVACIVLVPGLVPVAVQQGETEVPVTIKELDVAGAIREFQAFQQRLDSFREVIGEGRSVAQETAQILAELRRTANAENGYNEQGILTAVAGYVDSVIHKQVELVDFLES